MTQSDVLSLLFDGAVSFIYYYFRKFFFSNPAGTNTSPRHYNNTYVCHPNRSCRRDTSISWPRSHARDAFSQGSMRRNERTFLRLLLYIRGGDVFEGLFEYINHLIFHGNFLSTQIIHHY